MESGTDRRRLAGAATRQRLIEAASDALAAGGARGVSLRAVSKAADANVAAVKYHFGSREALIAEVVESSGREVISRQRVALDQLAARPDRSTARAWAEAWASPLVRVATAPTREERRLGRIIGQALADPDSALDARFRQLISETDEQLIRGVRTALPRVDERDLRLRLAFMASALAGLASGTFEPLLALADPDDDLERRVLDLLVAVMTAP